MTSKAESTAEDKKRGTTPQINKALPLCGAPSTDNTRDVPHEARTLYLLKIP